MKKIIFSLLLFLLIPFKGLSNSIDLPTIKICGIDFYVYEADAKDLTIFSIARELNLSDKEIKRYNPDVSTNLEKGQRIFLPVSDFTLQNKESIKSGKAHLDFFNHKVKSGETLYGISKMYNIPQDSIVIYNPSSSDGIKSGEMLRIPQQLSADSIKNDNIIFHTIAKGNTLYNISKTYNTTIEEIIGLNPGISPTNFKVDDIIKIKPNTIDNTPLKKQTKVIFVNYEVKKDDSIEQLSHKFNVSEKSILEANSINKLPKKGNLISIPIFDRLTVEEKFEYERNLGIEIYDSINDISQGNNIKIALFLPFMIDAKNKKEEKQAKLYRELYKGFLIAVDSLRKTTDKKIMITAVDTKNSLDTINSILNDTSIAKMDLIIGPNEKDHLNAVSEFSKNNDINLVNPFIIRSEDYNNNDKFFHVNIPNNYMHTKLINYYDELFEDWTPVFLNSTNNESKDVALKIKEEIDNRGKHYEEIRFDKYLSYEVLDSLLPSDKKYVFIPLNGSRPMLKKITPALKKFKETRLGSDLALFGYPEWTSYNYEYKKSFMELNTFVYSRFFLDETHNDYDWFMQQYDKWYGEKLVNAIPVFGILGYDLGMYFIPNLLNNSRLDKELTKYSGIQTPFNYKRLNNWSGHINWAICFIHYTNDKIERMVR